MPGMLIIAHAPLASALKAVAEHTFPDCAGVLAALDVTRDMSIDDVETRARELLERVRTPEALIFTDVFGATPCNIAQRLPNLGVRMHCVSGLNLPMLLRVLNYPEQSLDELAQTAASGGRGGIVVDTP